MNDRAPSTTHLASQRLPPHHAAHLTQPTQSLIQPHHINHSHDPCGSPLSRPLQRLTQEVQGGTPHTHLTQPPHVNQSHHHLRGPSIISSPMLTPHHSQPKQLYGGEVSGVGSGEAVLSPPSPLARAASPQLRQLTPLGQDSDLMPRRPLPTSSNHHSNFSHHIHPLFNSSHTGTTPHLFTDPTPITGYSRSRDTHTPLRKPSPPFSHQGTNSFFSHTSLTSVTSLAPSSPQRSYTAITPLASSIHHDPSCPGSPSHQPIPKTHLGSQLESRANQAMSPPVPSHNDPKPSLQDPPSPHSPQPPPSPRSRPGRLPHSPDPPSRPTGDGLSPLRASSPDWTRSQHPTQHIQSGQENDPPQPHPPEPHPPQPHPPQPQPHPVRRFTRGGSMTSVIGQSQPHSQPTHSQAPHLQGNSFTPPPPRSSSPTPPPRPTSTSPNSPLLHASPHFHSSPHWHHASPHLHSTTQLNATPQRQNQLHASPHLHCSPRVIWPQSVVERSEREAGETGDASPPLMQHVGCRRQPTPTETLSQWALNGSMDKRPTPDSGSVTWDVFPSPSLTHSGGGKWSGTLIEMIGEDGEVRTHQSLHSGVWSMGGGRESGSSLKELGEVGGSGGGRSVKVEVGESGETGYGRRSRSVVKGSMGTRGSGEVSGANVGGDSGDRGWDHSPFGTRNVSPRSTMEHRDTSPNPFFPRQAGPFTSSLCPSASLNSPTSQIPLTYQEPIPVTSSLPSTSDLSDPRLPTLSAIFSLEGFKGESSNRPNRTNQDRAFTHEIANQVAAYGVFDGHGDYGHDVADFVSSAFLTLIKRQFADGINLNLTERQILIWLNKSFKIVADDLSRSQLDVSHSGCTASVVLRYYHAVYVGYVGDSKVVGYHFMGSRPIRVTETPDHNPSSPQERARIEERGAKVGEILFPHLNKTVSRIVEAGISVSRAFGDQEARRWGLVCDPEFVKFDVPQPTSSRGISRASESGVVDSEQSGRNPFQRMYHSYMLVLASDGLWDTLSTHEVLRFCRNEQQDKFELMETVRLMSETAWTRRYNAELRSDDTTVIVALL
eukprot:GHVN01102497.1.p1 GENE.GHVN01102497.1~~GHVN01102497.1.p1  ORF type:complete len:1053 (-),score=305.04 GHVN01102497.1:353-3511(-)